MPDYKVTIETIFSTDKEADEDELHDAIVDHFDVVDLEGSYDATIYDDAGDETDDTESVAYNCDMVRNVTVEKMED